MSGVYVQTSQCVMDGRYQRILSVKFEEELMHLIPVFGPYIIEPRSWSGI